MSANKEDKKTQNEKKYQLASAWSLHLLKVLNDKLEKEVKTDIETSGLD